MTEWIGCDFDGTIAYYDGWQGETTFGKPIPLMIERIKGWLADGIEVRVVTARVGVQNGPHAEETVGVEVIREAIENYCEEHIGVKLQVTNEKDMGMMELWDDRAVQVIVNTGRPISDFLPEPWITER